MQTTPTRVHRFWAAVAAFTVFVGVVLGGTSQAAGTAVSAFGTATPAVTSDPDTSKVELGMQFKASVAGQVTGVRFYKGAGNTGTHTGSLWRGSTRVATVTFKSETASGWQTAAFTAPVTLTVGTTYTVSYLAPGGHYADDQNYPWPRVSGPLTGVKGTYVYGGGYPTQVWNGSNYWVDVSFVPAVTSTTTSPSSTTTAASTTPNTSTTATSSPTASSTTTVPTTTTATSTTTPTTTTVPTTTTTPPPTGWFTSDATGRIYDPAGKEFIPVGVNANGPDWVWAGATIGKSSSMNAWRFNTLRVNSCFVGGCPDSTGAVGGDYHTNDNLDGIVTEYTSRKYVIMIGNMMWGGNANYSGHEQALVDWWKATATRYKDNPYVWFNLVNEPTLGGSENLPAWGALNTQLATAIRSVAPNNMIVMDGNAWAQEKNAWTCDPAAPAGPDQAHAYQNSAIVNNGPQLESQFSPVLFSIHVYGMWGGNENYGCTNALWDSTFTAYVNKVHSLHLPLVIGETGSVTNKADEGWAEGGSWNAVHMLTRVLPTAPIKTGVLFWHGQGGISFSLFDPSVGWDSDPLNPQGGAALNWKGHFMYDYAHQVNP